MNLSARVGHIKQEVLSKGTVLNIGKYLLHSLLGFLGDNLRTCDVVAVFSGVGDGVTHTLKAALVDKVNDKLHFVDTLEVSVSWVVASLNEGLKARLHKGANAAAENRLLAEQIGLGLGAEGGLKHARASAADT